MAQKGSKRPSPNHHKAIWLAPMEESIYVVWVTTREEGRGSSNAAKENTKTKAEKNPSNHCKPFFWSTTIKLPNQDLLHQDLQAESRTTTSFAKKRTTTSRSAGRHHAHPHGGRHHAQPHGGKLRAALQSKFRSGRGHGWLPDGGGGSDGKT
jgi:hypothetical protein